jgi:hypothetical protein
MLTRDQFTSVFLAHRSWAQSSISFDTSDICSSLEHAQSINPMWKLTPIVLLLLVVVAQLAFPLGSHSPLSLQHLLGLTLSSAWETLSGIEIL